MKSILRKLLHWFDHILVRDIYTKEERDMMAADAERIRLATKLQAQRIGTMLEKRRLENERLSLENARLTKEVYPDMEKFDREIERLQDMVAEYRAMAMLGYIPITESSYANRRLRRRFN